MNQIQKKNKILIYPGFLWFIVFFMLPLAVIFAYAFTDNFLRFGQPLHFTFNNFQQIFERKYYFSLLLRSLRISLVTTVYTNIVMFSCPERIMLLHNHAREPLGDFYLAYLFLVRQPWCIHIYNILDMSGNNLCFQFCLTA